MALVSCPECGKEISDAALVCPHCGHPIKEPQPQDAPPSPRKSKRPIIIAACVLVLAAVVVVFAGVQQKRNSDMAAYIASLNELRTQAIRGGSIAETMCNLTPFLASLQPSNVFTDIASLALVAPMSLTVALGMTIRAYSSGICPVFLKKQRTSS